MTFEGEHKVIPIKGIARAGADSICEDGAMNEVVGFEYKDGSYVPYKEKDSITTEVPNDALGYYIHKTSTGNIALFIRPNGSLYWIPEDDITGASTSWADMTLLSAGPIKDVEFIKNIICISTPEKLLYMLFQEGEYKDWTVDKEGLPHINFRVDIGIGGNKDALGIKRSVYYEVYPEGGIKDALIAPLIAAKGKAVEEGGLTGYFLVCAAYRLKTGGYIKASNPVLMCRPMHKEKDKFYNEKTDSNKFTLYTDGSVSKTFTPSINEEGVVVYISPDANYSNPDVFSYLKKNVVDVNEGITMYGNGIYIVDGNKDVYSMRYADDCHIFYPPMGSSALHLLDESTKITQAYYSAAVPTNKLQYKINSDISVNESLISGLCIFISQEIDPFLNIDKKDFIDEAYKTILVRLSELSLAKSLHATFKTNDEIENEIKNINNLYLVHEIDYADIKKSNEWIDVDLKGKLGDALVTRETLPISAFDNTIIKDAEMDTYNSRLHVFNHKEEERCGYNIEDFNLYGGYGQYSASGESQYESACIVVDYKNENGTSRVVKHFAKPTLTISGANPIFNQYIAYHRGDATSVTIYCQKILGSSYSVNKYELSKSKNGGYSFHLTEDLTPTLTTSDLNTMVLPKQFNDSTYKESMRVSDTFLPQIFQYANTYTIGNGRIIGLASLSIALSQDTFGQYPLLVFCTDGIYSMGVDTTGAGVYNNIAPFSREVCVNRNTICEIDGAVLFASSKGLMIATAQGVQEFLPQLNGGPRHLPESTEINKGLGLLWYRDIINYTNMLGSISMKDFIDFLSDKDTVVSYVSEKNKVIVYNGGMEYVYWIGIPTRNVTKLPICIKLDNNNYPTEQYVKNDGVIITLPYLSDKGDVQCLLQTRPIKIVNTLKSSLRVVARGYLTSNDPSMFACMLVLGSLDAINWQPIGYKTRQFNGGFNDLGCVTDRVSCNYIMVIVTGNMNSNSHIDGIELTVNSKYNNKLK